MYKLYIGINNEYSKENKIIKNKLKDVLQIMDYYILEKKPKAKYLLIMNSNGTDEILYFGFDEESYIRFKEGLKMNKTSRHFLEEDNNFLDMCMKNSCNGCRYRKLCDKTEKREEELKNDKIPYTKEIKLPNNRGSQKK